MEQQSLIAGALDGPSARRVYGEPFEKNGLTVIPAATVTGVGVRGTSDEGNGAAGDGSVESSGGGFALTARPSGAWVLQEGTATWKPAVDVNRIVFGGQILALVGIVVVGRILAPKPQHRSAFP
jgi:hypothetical protein